MTNENTEQTIEILEYAARLAKAVNEVGAAVTILGFNPEDATPLDYVTAARMVYADKALRDAVSNVAESDSFEGGNNETDHLPQTPGVDETGYLRRMFYDTADKVLGKFNGVTYYRNSEDAIKAVNIKTFPFAGFWCSDCDSVHLIERTAE